MTRLERNGEKVLLKKGKTFEVGDERAKELLKYSKDFRVVTMDVKPSKVEKAAAEKAAKEKAELEEKEKLEKEEAEKKAELEKQEAKEKAEKAKK